MNWDNPEIQRCPKCGKHLNYQICQYESVEHDGFVNGEPPDIIGFECSCGMIWNKKRGWQ